METPSVEVVMKPQEEGKREIEQFLGDLSRTLRSAAIASDYYLDTYHNYASDIDSPEVGMEPVVEFCIRNGMNSLGDEERMVAEKIVGESEVEFVKIKSLMELGKGPMSHSELVTDEARVTFEQLDSIKKMVEFDRAGEELIALLENEQKFVQRAMQEGAIASEVVTNIAQGAVEQIGGFSPEFSNSVYRLLETSIVKGQTYRQSLESALTLHAPLNLDRLQEIIAKMRGQKFPAVQAVEE